VKSNVHWTTDQAFANLQHNVHTTLMFSVIWVIKRNTEINSNKINKTKTSIFTLVYSVTMLIFLKVTLPLQNRRNVILFAIYRPIVVLYVVKIKQVLVFLVVKITITGLVFVTDKKNVLHDRMNKNKNDRLQ